MPAPLTPDEKAAREQVLARTRKVIKEAGGPKEIIAALRPKHSELNEKRVSSFGLRGRIPDKYLLDIIGLTKYAPSFLKPELFNRRHKVFIKHYGGVTKQ